MRAINKKTILLTMQISDIEKRIHQLRAEIAHHEHLYRIENSPEISDDEFDVLMRELRTLEKQYPQFATEKSPAKKVGSDLSEGFKSVKHISPMLSLDNVFDTRELAEFDERLRKILLLKAETLYSVEPKIDGAGVSAVYINGKLERLLTRGDGEKGDDITRNAFAIKNLPLTLSGNNIPTLLEIRGEVYMTRSEFDRLSQLAIEAEIQKEQKKSDEPLSQQRIAEIRQKRPYANPRNLTAGSLKLLDLDVLKERNLEVVFYSVGAEKGLNLARQSNLPERLKSLGLPAVNWHATACGVDEAFKKICELEEIRNDFPFNTDGAVLKLDDCSLHADAGFTSHAPRWAIAWKYRAEQKQTRLLGITLQVGRTGAITPVAELEPVYIAGTTVSRATLHNLTHIKHKDIRIGDTVVIEKAGEIIPAVIRVEQELRPQNSVEFEFPKKCPECNSDLVFTGEKMLARCPNFACPPQVKGRIEHFASRDCLDIKGLGESVVDLLVEKLGITSPADLYTITKQQLLSDNVGKFQEKSASNLINAIEKSKTQELWRLIFGLGISEIGERYAKDLATKFESLDNLMNATLADIQSIEGMGGKSGTQSVRAESVLAFFADAQNREMIERLRSSGLNFNAKTSAANSKLAGKIFVLTGTLKSMDRNSAKARIEALGGRVGSSVTKQTSFLVSDGEISGSKMQKAQELGTKIIFEDEFLAMIVEENSTENSDTTNTQTQQTLSEALPTDTPSKDIAEDKQMTLGI